MMDVWKYFQFIVKKNLFLRRKQLSSNDEYGFFQPYKHIQYSVTVIYITILNLPRAIRSKQENTILVGLIPGSHEPHHDINPSLEPFAEDLLKYWNGVELSVASIITYKKKHSLCSSMLSLCDLPAGKKVCGYVGHNALNGCSKFEDTVEETMNFAGFNRENWPPRTGERHRRDACSLAALRTKSELKNTRSEFGCIPFC